MCACEATFICARCRGTAADPRYLDDAPRTRAEEEYDRVSEYVAEVVLPALRVV